MTNAHMKIMLRDVLFHAYHGVMEQERTVGNEFKLDLDVILPAASDAYSDTLENTVSYVDLYDIARQCMESPRKLLETVASEIGHRIKERFPQIESGCVTIIKLAPPIPGIDGSAGVEYSF